MRCHTQQLRSVNHNNKVLVDKRCKAISLIAQSKAVVNSKHPSQLESSGVQAVQHAATYINNFLHTGTYTQRSVAPKQDREETKRQIQNVSMILSCNCTL